LLKQEINKLKFDNDYLRMQFVKIDEFRLAMNNETRIDQFNQRRVNLLKAHLSRQRRHISNLNESLKLKKLFYKDLLSILTFLV